MYLDVFPHKKIPSVLTNALAHSLSFRLSVALCPILKREESEVKCRQRGARAGHAMRAFFLAEADSSGIIWVSRRAPFPRSRRDEYALAPSN